MSAHKSKSTHIDCGNLFKLLIVGDSGVGKSAMLSQYAKSTFNPTFSTTIGVDYDVCNADVNGETVRLQVWDTAGQERFRAITQAFYRKADGIFLVYDSCDMSTLENAKNTWLPNIRKYAPEDTKVVLVGNKIDNKCVAQQKGIDTEAIREEATKFAIQQGIQLIEVSAKHNNNVDAAFFSIAILLKKRWLRRAESDTVDIGANPKRTIFAKLCGLLKSRKRRKSTR